VNKKSQRNRLQNEVNAQVVDQVLAELWKMRGKHADIDQVLDDFRTNSRILMMP
jgi:hypothetical protein